MLISCTTNQSKFNSGLKISDWQCKLSAPMDTETYTDSKGLFKIQIPNGWWTHEGLLDTLHGISSVDSTLDLENTACISLVILNTEYNSFLEYVKNEHRILKNRDNINLKEYGQSSRVSDSAYWFLFKSQESDSTVAHNFMLYLSQENSDTCYILHSLVFGENEWENRLCNVKENLFTFEKL